MALLKRPPRQRHDLWIPDWGCGQLRGFAEDQLLEGWRFFLMAFDLSVQLGTFEARKRVALWFLSDAERST
jgi:hypothetical protein